VRRTCGSPAEALSALYSHRNLYWCEWCEKPIFFPFKCRRGHSDGVDINV
jgi:hypothetical protein